MSMTDDEEERVEPKPHVAVKLEPVILLVKKNGAIDIAEEKIQKATSALGNLYQKIEKDYHGNRKAVKLIRQLEAGTIDAAYDFMRTFMPLAKAFDLIPAEDLADMAGGESIATNVAQFPSKLDQLSNATKRGKKPTEEEIEAQRQLDAEEFENLERKEPETAAAE